MEKINDIGKTTLMIRNIPNRYTKNMLMRTINKNHSGKYDFFYLPIDFNVHLLRYHFIYILRINAMLGMLLLTFSVLNILNPFINNSITKDGRSLIVRK